MLKIKDNVDLKELEKFKYQSGIELLRPLVTVYFKNIKRFLYRIEIVIYEETRKIRIIKWSKKYSGAYKLDENFKGQEKYIKDIIKAGLVEKVEE